MAKANMARIEETARLALAFAEAFNAHDVAAMTAIMRDDCHFESSEPAPDDAFYAGKKAIAQYWHRYFQTHPQAQLEAEELFGLGLRSVMRWRCEWGSAAERREVRGVFIFRVNQGAISELYGYVKR
ncbi:MAG: nuclear transport factor 2 family protein [Candidatus Promineifilaceae bacterium]|nr:nuclear transport factor 2 family protein [Anaerolineaceae bacterium]